MLNKKHYTRSITLPADLTDLCGEFVEGFNISEANATYQNAIETCLQEVRPNWFIVGSEILGPHNEPPLTDNEEAHLAHAIENIKVNLILEENSL